MIRLRQSSDRGHFDFGWLDTFHTFSFADYHDPAFMGYRDLRVINDDRIAAKKGFGTHPHRNMEIITYVLEGELAHKDSMGNGSIILPGDVQYMSAGSGVTHSEFNNADVTTHLLQIWILPAAGGSQPRYDQRHFENHQKSNRFKLVVSGDGREDSIKILQDADLYVSLLEPSSEVSFLMRAQRYGYVHVARGELKLNGTILSQGDGAFVENETRLNFKSQEEISEILLFDMK